MEAQVAAIETGKGWSWSKFATFVCFALAAGLLLATLISAKRTSTANASTTNSSQLAMAFPAR
ncbi:MAG: hypothetical protein JNM89_05065 [Hyphomicrobiaceae bacterium]|nr:hypothetical protein [Hyphomicrobiaceae bacterium]